MTLFEKFWKIKVLPSAQTTTWRVLINSITTKNNLLRRGVLLVSSLCGLCGEEEKIVCHLFFKCKVAWRVWGLYLSWLGCFSVNHFDAKVHFLMFGPRNDKGSLSKIWGGVWIAIVGEIWKHRK